MATRFVGSALVVSVASVLAVVAVAFSHASEPRDLRAVLASVCAANDIALRYDAAPGIVTVPYGADQPVDRQLELLLENHSYVMTRRRDRSTGEERITRIHVLAAERRRSTLPNPSGFTIHQSLLDAVFMTAGRPDEAAIEALIADVRTSPQRLRAFLATDPAIMARDLRRYPRAAQVLRTIARRTDLEAGVAEKLHALLAALE